MKIAYIDELFRLVPNGGISVWSNRLVSQLIEKGVDVKIFSYSDSFKSEVPDFIKVFPNVREVFVFPLLGKKAILNLGNSYDLVHLVTPYTLERVKPKVPAVVSVHYLISRQTIMFCRLLPKIYKIFFNRFSFKLFLSYEARGFRNADCITVPREAYKNYLIKHMGVEENKIKIIKYGIDHHFFRPSESKKEKERIALFVGRGSLPKGFDTLIAAASKINGKVIAVASSIPRYLQKRILTLKNFQVISGISQEKLLQFYQNAFVYVLPSLAEGSPISTLEAMACGLPVVCTVEGGGGHIEHDVNGYIFPFKDSDKLAEQVNYLFDHPEIAQQFGKFNRQTVERELTLPVIASQIKDIYHQLIKG
jgi:glycosyltransferase involved in cell wall biosynthesis